MKNLTIVPTHWEHLAKVGTRAGKRYAPNLTTTQAPNSTSTGGSGTSEVSVRSVLAACEKTPTDAVELDYDSRNPFVICGKSFTPIYRGSKSKVCSYCGASFLPSADGETCTICEVGTVGGEGSGLITYMR